jgi:prepilin-type N-terminal cleavage/methylation domain-containing protein
MRKGKNSAFSLVELSIVIIIIGLLFVGVTGGSKLIKSAKLNKVMRDVSAVDTSFLAFLQAYDGYPGDYNDAQSFWGTSGVVNGDGDGKIEVVASATTNDEVSSAFSHMAKAELTDGIYDITITNGSYAALSELNSRMVIVNEVNSTGASLGGFASSLAAKNMILLGRTTSVARAVGEAGVHSAFISPRDMFTLDSKFDDGSPISGKISYRDESSSVGNVTSATCTDGSSAYLSSGSTADADGCNLAYKMKIR